MGFFPASINRRGGRHCWNSIGRVLQQRETKRKKKETKTVPKREGERNKSVGPLCDTRRHFLTQPDLGRVFCCWFFFYKLFAILAL